MNMQHIVVRDNENPEITGALTLEGGEMKRQFVPSMAAEYSHRYYLPEDERPGLLSYNSSKQWWQLQQTLLKGPESWGGKLAENTLVLAIANYHNPKQNPQPYRHSWAVCFGPKSQYNHADDTLKRCLPFSACCLRKAMWQALGTIGKILHAQRPIHSTSILIMTRSKQLVDALAWRREPDDTTRQSKSEMQLVGSLITFFKGIDVLWNQIEKRFGVSIQLWFTLDLPIEAIELAKSALPSLPAPPALPVPAWKANSGLSRI